MYLRNNPLISIFRAGFGLALELQWETQRWLEKAWFRVQGFHSSFWDEEWGGTLAGLLQKRPRLFQGSQADEPYKDFESLSEVDDCRNTVRRLTVLDRLLEILSSEHLLKKRWTKDPLFTFHGLIFNFWARSQLNLDPGFSPLSMEQARAFFQLLRPKEGKPPYRMHGFGNVFVKDLTAYASDFEPHAARLLKETLSILWEKFVDEYAWVATAELDGRFMKFILISPSPEAAPS
jgi:hypothetical protein